MAEVVEEWDSLAEVGWHWVVGVALVVEGCQRCIGTP
jgi:hypothetical protein